VSLTGAVVGASIGFGLSRVLGRGAVERLDSDRLHRLDDLLRRSGLLAVIGVRLVPLLLPFLLALGGLGALTIGGAIVIRRRRKLAVQPRT